MFASKEKEENAIAQSIYFVSPMIFFYKADCGDEEKICQKGKGEFYERWEASTRGACPALQSRVWYTSIITRVRGQVVIQKLYQKIEESIMIVAIYFILRFVLEIYWKYTRNLIICKTYDKILLI